MRTHLLIATLTLAAAGLWAQPCRADCGPPPPPEPCGSWRCIAGDGSYTLDPYPAGFPCGDANICDGRGNCSEQIMTPVLSNFHMVNPAQVGFRLLCGGGPVGPNTYTIAVSDFTAENQGSNENLRVTGLQFPHDGGLMRDIRIEWFRKKKVIE